MHTDGVGDRAEIERSQMLDSFGEERILQPDDFDATFNIVRCRCSRLFRSQFAFIMQFEMKLLSASPFAEALIWAA